MPSIKWVTPMANASFGKVPKAIHSTLSRKVSEEISTIAWNDCSPWTRTSPSDGIEIQVGFGCLYSTFGTWRKFWRSSSAIVCIAWNECPARLILFDFQRRDSTLQRRGRWSSWRDLFGPWSTELSRDDRRWAIANETGWICSLCSKEVTDPILCTDDECPSLARRSSVEKMNEIWKTFGWPTQKSFARWVWADSDESNW